MLIMLGVDVTLGPLITLIVFNTRKTRKALVFDLIVIGILQFSALLYGTSVMFHGRPVFVVFVKNSFDMVLANQLNDEDVRKARSAEYRSLPLTGPVYVYSELPADIKERNEVVLAAFSGKDLPVFPKYYQPYAGHEPAVGAAAQPIASSPPPTPARCPHRMPPTPPPLPSDWSKSAACRATSPAAAR